MNTIAVATLIWAIAICESLAQSTLRGSQDELEDDTKFEIVTDQHIVGGSTVNSGAYPAFVQYGLPGTLCGASLIYEDIVLSAAHCGTPDTGRISVMGNSVARGNGEFSRRVDKVVIHPKYSQRNLLEYDVLVMKLRSPVKEITPVTLNTVAMNPTFFEKLTVVGFGRTCSDCGTSNSLLSTDLRYATHATCDQDWDGQLTQSIHLCAEAFEKDSCFGDSGGPIFDTSGKQVGITSFGDTTCGGGRMTVFTRISGVNEWIQRQICELSDNPPLSCIMSIIPSICISPNAMAIVKGKGKVAMKFVSVGDDVMTASGQYKTVFTNIHFDHSEPTHYLQIHSTLIDEKPLEVTEKHMIFLEGKPYPVPAAKVNVGDVIRTTDGPHRITNITSIVRRGRYNPITVDGTIVVDGVIASTFSTLEEGLEFIEIAGFKLLSQQSFSQIAYAPYRTMCMGVSLDLCKENDPVYNHFGRRLFGFWRRQHPLIQFILLIGLVLTLTFLHFLLNPIGIGIMTMIGAYRFFISTKKYDIAK